MIYAGAQKNIGPAGLTIAIISKDLLSSCNKDLPNIMNYDKHAQSGSMLNTPPTFAWYMAGKVFKWLKSLGGLKAVKERNYLKASTLYDYIDKSDFYSNPVAKNNRSIMNIPFILKSPDLDGTFLKEAESENLLNLKGHRSVGGMRASIYNAMPQEAIDDLIAFMEAFESKYG
jgi:phosphoserine aminotransferase